MTGLGTTKTTGAKPRAGYAGKGTHSYAGTYTFTRMGNGRWFVFDAAGKDTGADFKTLREAREWAAGQEVQS